MSDNISREITKDEAIKILESMSDISTQGEAIDMAIEALTYQNLSKPNNTCEVDLISRVDAIEAVGGVVIDEFDVSPTRGYDVAEKALSALPSADTEWIPCSERLPEKDELVLVTVWNDVTIAWRNIYGGWESAEDMYEKGDVTAWMPLPKPYREDGEA